MYDIIIVGGGPAGLNAALVLGRCRRKVVLCDTGHPRNESARVLNGYLGRDGTEPFTLRGIGRDEVRRYGVELVDMEVRHVRELRDKERPEGAASAFEVELADGRKLTSRKLLLATGVQDILPEIDGIETYYGRGVHHCPYCDGWEHRDQRIVAYGEPVDAVRLALALKTWSGQVTACTSGVEVPEKLLSRLKDNGIALRTEVIERLEGAGKGGELQRVIFADGTKLRCDAFFFHTAHVQQSELPGMLGCERDRNDEFVTREKQRTDVYGLYLAGDADGDVQFAIVAAAEGATAAVAINVELQKENMR